MSTPIAKASALEVKSVELKGELIEIKDRLDGLEALQAHVHRDEIEALIRKAVGESVQRKTLLRLCESPQTIPQLQSALGSISKQALNNHLTPLRDNGLLHHHSTATPVSYKWSPLIRRLNKAVRDKLLE